MEDDETRSDGLLIEAKADDPPDEWLGRIIDGRYQILERLGRGGMGEVFLAEHTSLLKRVALKVIHARFAGNDEIAARFAREAMTSAHIEHPNVASALDFGLLPEGGAYLVMQLVLGPSLSEYLAQQGALPYRETCQIAAQIADAVAAAHAMGIVHRDLKPDNVVLMPNEEGPPTVKVLDFGIAHVSAESPAPSAASNGLTRQGVVIGTPGYMPPEQATGQVVDERADLYALGVILWQLLMGTPPFEGSSFSEIVTRQLSGPAPDLVLDTKEGLPDALRRLVSSLLERSPAARPSSAIEVRDTLRLLFGGTGTEASKLVVASKPRSETLRVAFPRAAPQALRRNWRLPVAAALAAVIVVGLFHLATADDNAAIQTSAPPLATESAAAGASPAAAKADQPRAVPPMEDHDSAVTPPPQDEPSTPKRATSRKSRRAKQDRPRAVGSRLRRALGDLLQ